MTLLQRLNFVVSVKLEGGGLLYVDLANAVGRTIWLRRDYSSEAPITALLVSTLAPGDVFFDVGANVGFFSLRAARIVGDGGSVHAFEPLPNLAELLRRTIVANDLANMHIVEAAVGSQPGATSIAAMPDSAYSHLIEGASIIDTTHGGWKPVTVRQIALDDYAAKSVGRLPRLIKMDIEGSEVEALDGAARMLSDPEGPDVICEVGISHLARFGHSPSEVFDRFLERNYLALNPRTGRTMRVDDLSADEYNVFFVKRSRRT